MFLYSSTSPLFSQFRDQRFKNMLQAMITSRSGFSTVKKAPILTVDHLKKYIDAELDMLKSDLHLELKALRDRYLGLPFDMLIHDAVTLSNKTKYYSVGIQFTDIFFTVTML